jgi:hypothetical protein
MRWAGSVVRMGEKRLAYRVLMRKPEMKKKPLRSFKYRYGKGKVVLVLN